MKTFITLILVLFALCVVVFFLALYLYRPNGKGENHG